MNIKQQLQVLACAACLIGASAIQAQPVNTDEYTMVAYYEQAHDNPVARLNAQLESGAVTLTYNAQHGYLDSLLQALHIDPHSQVLVYSKTSLQYPLISPQTPRALYFSETTYIGYVLGSKIVEITTMDEKLGMVFYIFNNLREPPHYFDRENGRCLVCHDSNGTMGGGVPMLLAHSSIYTENLDNLLNVTGEGNVTDQTPLADRWGGWYVTGQHGTQTHLGNLLLPLKSDLDQIDKFKRGNLDTLENLFNTEPYLVPTSDIVALMVLEHQLTVQNQIAYVKFKAPAVLERVGQGASREADNWDALPHKAQQALARMLDKLVDVLLLTDAIILDEPISGTSQFTTWFQEQGLPDAQGQSLHELELQKRLFRYPLSYLVQSDDFATLPPYTRQYVLRRLETLLATDEGNERFKQFSSAERHAALRFLRSVAQADTDNASSSGL